MKAVLVRIPEKDVQDLDVLVKAKKYPNRNEAIRMAIHDLVRTEKKR